MNAADLKSEAQRAFSAWEYLRNDPMASRAQIDAARDRYFTLSVRAKSSPPPKLALTPTKEVR